MAVRLINLNVDKKIDLDTALKNLGGDEDVYYGMLNKFEDMTLNQTIKEIIAPYDAKQYRTVMEVAHSLKGASGYIGASRLYYQCYFI